MMLSNLRRKRVQRLDIEKYGVAYGKHIWWVDDFLMCDKYFSNFGNQKYSNLEIEKSFEYCRCSQKVVNNLYPFYCANKEIYNMILCPSGRFIMGMEDRKKKPTLITKQFLLSETEITQELYCAVMEINNPSTFHEDPKNPVECVSWYDALMFCNRLSDLLGLSQYYTIPEIPKDKLHVSEIKRNENSKGFRLPTQIEWEYAAKAGTKLKYSGSDDPNEVAWYSDNSNGTTHPVKQLKPNAWGFYDMSGNVFEWCDDVKDDHRGSIIIKGGCVGFNELLLSPTISHHSNASVPIPDIGFRVARYL